LDRRWFNIFVLPIADGRAGQAIQLTTARDFGRDWLYFGRMDLNIEPTWSPDGKEIIFLSNHRIPLGSGALWRIPAEPGGMEKARMIRREETLYRTRPDWSQDGTRIIYSSHLGSQFNNLFVLPSSGGEPYQLTFGDWDHFHPRWSPDGRRVVYVSNQHASQRAFGMGRRERIQDLHCLLPIADSLPLLVRFPCSVNRSGH
jgi:Tol biopolymer transport system component